MTNKRNRIIAFVALLSISCISLVVFFLQNPLIHPTLISPSTRYLFQHDTKRIIASAERNNDIYTLSLTNSQDYIFQCMNQDEIIFTLPYQEENVILNGFQIIPTNSTIHYMLFGQKQDVSTIRGLLVEYTFDILIAPNPTPLTITYLDGASIYGFAYGRAFGQKNGFAWIGRLDNNYEVVEEDVISSSTYVLDIRILQDREEYTIVKVGDLINSNSTGSEVHSSYENMRLLIYDLNLDIIREDSPIAAHSITNYPVQDMGSTFIDKDYFYSYRFDVESDPLFMINAIEVSQLPIQYHSDRFNPNHANRIVQLPQANAPYEELLSQFASGALLVSYRVEDNKFYAVLVWKILHQQIRYQIEMTPSQFEQGFYAMPLSSTNPNHHHILLYAASGIYELTWNLND